MAKKIFSNLPVRRNLYKKGNKAKEDLKKIESLCRSYAIINPKVKFSLVHNKTPLFQKQSCPGLRPSLDAVLGHSVSSHLELVTLNVGDGLNVEMYVPNVAKPSDSMARANTEKTFVFVNHRPVDLKPVCKVLKQIYSEARQLRSEKNPIAVVNIQVVAKDVDVNLDPNKYSVMLKDQDELLKGLVTKLRAYYKLDVPAEENCDPNADLLSRSLFDKSAHNVSDVSSIGEEQGDRVLILPENPSEQHTAKVSEKHLAPKKTIEVERANKIIRLEKESQEAVVTQPSSLSFSLNGAATSTQKSDSLSPAGDGILPPNGVVNMSTSLESFPADERSFSSVHTSRSPNGEECGTAQISASHSFFSDQPGGSHDSKIDRCEFKKIGPSESSFSNQPGGSRLSEQSSKQMTLNAWSTGRAVLEHGSTKPAQPVTLLLPPPPLEHSADKRKLSDSLSNESPVQTRKKPKKNLDETEVKIDAFLSRVKDKSKKTDGNRTMKGLVAPMGTPILNKKQAQKVIRKEIKIAFNIHKNVKKCPPLGEVEKSSNLIGKFEKVPYWLFSADNDICILNHHRFQEMELYHRLLKNQRLPVGESGIDIQPLRSNHCWSEDLEQTLLNMVPRSAEHIITDERLEKNGFAVKWAPGQEPLLVGSCTAVNFLGVSDLIEILEAVRSNPEVSVADSRPGKIRAYLTGEVVRMSRQNPPGIDRQTAEKICSKLPTSVWTKCLHEKNVTHKICSYES